MATLLVEGATERQLAERFDLSQPVIHRDVVEIEKRWRKEATQTIDTWKARILAGHQHTIAEASTEWHRSKEEAQKIVEVTELREEANVTTGDELAMDDQPTPTRLLELTQRTVTTEGRTGDPRYLTVITNARAEQAKIVGAYAPVKGEVGGLGGTPLTVQLIEVIAPQPPEPEPAS